MAKIKPVHPSLKPILEPYDDKTYRLVKRFKFVDVESKTLLTIEPGFVFDGASIPRVFWTSTGSPYDPKYIGPALIHDYLYKYHEDDLRRYSREEEDALFLKGLELNGVNRWQRFKMHRAVRMFGWVHWKN